LFGKKIGKKKISFDGLAKKMSIKNFLGKKKEKIMKETVEKETENETNHVYDNLLELDKVNDSILENFEDKKLKFSDYTNHKDIEELFLQTCIFGDAKGLEYLISQNINFNINTKYDLYEEQTLLHISTKFNHFDVSKILVKCGINVNNEDKFLRTPLHIACSMGKNDLVLLLLSSGADMTMRDIYGQFPIHLAFFKFEMEVIENMILFGADLNMKKFDGSTIIHDVIMKNDVKVLKYLISLEIFDETKKIKLNIKNKKGNTPFFTSIIEGKLDHFKLLIENSQINTNTRNEMDMNAFHIAALYGRLEILTILSEHPKTKLMLKDVTYKGANALHIASSASFVAGVSKLLELGLDINAKDENGDTPLHKCLKTQNLQMTKIFLMYGANLNIQNKNKETPKKLISKIFK
jgi:cytohesin